MPGIKRTHEDAFGFVDPLGNNKRLCTGLYGKRLNGLSCAGNVSDSVSQSGNKNTHPVLAIKNDGQDKLMDKNPQSGNEKTHPVLVIKNDGQDKLIAEKPQFSLDFTIFLNFRQTVSGADATYSTEEEINKLPISDKDKSALLSALLSLLKITTTAMSELANSEKSFEFIYILLQNNVLPSKHHYTLLIKQLSNERKQDKIINCFVLMQTQKIQFNDLAVTALKNFFFNIDKKDIAGAINFILALQKAEITVDDIVVSLINLNYFKRKKIDSNGAIDLILLMQKAKITVDDIVVSLIKKQFLEYRDFIAATDFILEMQKKGIACDDIIVTLIEECYLKEKPTNEEENNTVAEHESIYNAVMFISQLKKKQIKYKNIINTLIEKSNLNDEELIEFFSLMQKEGVKCDDIIVTLIEKSDLNDEEFIEFFSSLQIKGVECDDIICNFIRKNYLNKGDINNANAFISNLKKKGVIISDTVSNLLLDLMQAVPGATSAQSNYEFEPMEIS